MITFGINLGFAIKRWPEPRQWAAIVREDLALDCVQFSYDLLDPWWPEHRALARRVRQAADDYGISIHSAQVGLAMYTYNGLLHPDADARAAANEWWKRAIGNAGAWPVAAGRPTAKSLVPTCGVTCRFPTVCRPSMRPWTAVG